ncbi:MAG: MFS transporter [Planctomycetaceae bacterium]|nr:MFS transporter [Planctomycetaceae bacterium]
MSSEPRLSSLPNEPPTARRFVIFALAAGTSWFLYLHRYTWNFIRPALEEETQLSNVELDGLYTLFNVTYSLFQIPSGVVCDLFGPHLFLAIIIALWSLVLPFFGLTTNPAGLGAFRLLFGASQAGGYPSLSKVTRSWFPLRTRTTMQGLIASFFGRSGGAMSSIIMGTLLIGLLGLSWRMALVAMSIAGLGFAFLFWWFCRNSPEEDPWTNQAERDLIREGEVDNPDAPPVLPFRRVVQNRSMLVFMVQQFMNAGADYIYVAIMGSYFLNARGIEAAEAGLLVSLPLWGGAIGGVVGGILNDELIQRTGNRRWSRSGVGFAGKFLACLGMFVAIQQETAMAAATWLFIVKFFTDWTQPTVWGTCTDMGGRYSATAFSIINTSGSVGGIVTPLVGGFVLDYFSHKEVVDGVEKLITNYNPLFALVAAMYLISASCWFFIDCTHSLEHDNEPELTMES